MYTTYMSLRILADTPDWTSALGCVHYIWDVQKYPRIFRDTVDLRLNQPAVYIGS